MTHFWNRFSGYLFLSLFLALATGPFTGRTVLEKTEDRLLFSAVALSQEALDLACQGRVFQEYPNVSDEFPLIRDAVKTLSSGALEAGGALLYEADVEGFIRRLAGHDADSVCFDFEGGTFKVAPFLTPGMGSLYLAGMKATPDGTPFLKPSHLSEFAGLRQYAINLHEQLRSPGGRTGLVGDGGYYEKQDVDIDIEQLNALNGKLDAHPMNMSFVMGDFLIAGRIENVHEISVEQIAGFKAGRIAAAFVFLFSGLNAMKKACRKRPGPAALLMDALCVVFVASGAFFLLECGFEKFLNMKAVFDAPVAKVAFAAAYAPSAALLALLSTRRESVKKCR